MDPLGPQYMPTVIHQANFKKKAVLDFKWHSLEILAWYISNIGNP